MYVINVVSVDAFVFCSQTKHRKDKNTNIKANKQAKKYFIGPVSVYWNVTMDVFLFYHNFLNEQGCALILFLVAKVKFLHVCITF